MRLYVDVVVGLKDLTPLVAAVLLDFVDELTTDSLIPIVMNNNYQKSKKIYGVQVAGMSADMADENVAIATQEVAESWNASGLACLISEAGTTASTTSSITTANLKKLVLADRKQIRDAKGKADVILMTTDTYAKLLEGFVMIENQILNAFKN